MTAQVGARYLLHAGACPKAILAYQPLTTLDELIERYGLTSYTQHTLSEREALVDHLRLIFERGYAESEEDVDLLAYAIAVPIIAHDGQVNAAMSIAGPIQRFDMRQRRNALALLARAADRISTALGAPTLPSSSIRWDALGAAPLAEMSLDADRATRSGA
jgi:DNA-binding IclR family transcriptional regulator